MRARLGLVVLLLGPLAGGAADTLDAVRTLLVAYDKDPARIDQARDLVEAALAGDPASVHHLPAAHRRARALPRGRGASANRR